MDPQRRTLCLIGDSGPGRSHLLIGFDGRGYMELDRRGAELLFYVLAEREEKNSIAFASNELFSGWTKIFTDRRLRAAILDRPTFKGTIILNEATPKRHSRFSNEHRKGNLSLFRPLGVAALEPGWP